MYIEGCGSTMSMLYNVQTTNFTFVDKKKRKEIYTNSTIGVVTPLPSPLLFSENGHVARHDWLFGGGGDSFSENGECNFYSSRFEEATFSILQE
jgi:hypothetical protein